MPMATKQIGHYDAPSFFADCPSPPQECRYIPEFPLRLYPFVVPLWPSGQETIVCVERKTLNVRDAGASQSPRLFSKQKSVRERPRAGEPKFSIAEL